jgi:uracil-DNA glycosylase
MEWNLLIEQELKKTYFQDLVTFLKNEDQQRLILPPKEKRLSCFKLTPYEDVKVVIIGQDPYHDIGQAHGLAFSVEQGTYPPSLKNIYKELVDDLKIPYPKTGNLTHWAKQGVLLLNTCLTVVAHQALSHQGRGWETFTSEVVKTINLKTTSVVFVLWGAHAQKMKQLITNPIHHIITSPHPSPLSAMRGFFGSKPFSKTNAYLMSSNLTLIDWTLT